MLEWTLGSPSASNIYYLRIFGIIELAQASEKLEGGRASYCSLVLCLVEVSAGRTRFCFDYQERETKPHWGNMWITNQTGCILQVE